MKQSQIDNCTQLLTHSKVKVEQRGRKAVFKNTAGAAFRKIHCDGCLIKAGLSADWIVVRDGVGHLVIELKGKDVEHAMKQVHATAAVWLHQLRNGERFAGLIVANQFPKVNTVVQRQQSIFRKCFSGPLHIVCKNYEYEFQRVLEFGGPL
jgi:hypothetical protein